MRLSNDADCLKNKLFKVDGAKTLVQSRGDSLDGEREEERGTRDSKSNKCRCGLRICRSTSRKLQCADQRAAGRESVTYVTCEGVRACVQISQEITNRGSRLSALSPLFLEEKIAQVCLLLVASFAMRELV